MKLFLYADETIWTSTPGFLLVAVAAAPPDRIDDLQNQVRRLETESGRAQRKWAHTLEKRKTSFLQGLEGLLSGLPPVGWRAYAEIENQVDQTAAAIAAAAQRIGPDATVYVMVDGYNDAECHRVRAALRGGGIRFKKVVGGRDESEPLLRLADALAGFLGDVNKSKPYALKLWGRLGVYFVEV